MIRTRTCTKAVCSAVLFASFPPRLHLGQTRRCYDVRPRCVCYRTESGRTDRERRKRTNHQHLSLGSSPSVKANIIGHFLVQCSMPQLCRCQGSRQHVATLSFIAKIISFSPKKIDFCPEILSNEAVYGSSLS